MKKIFEYIVNMTPYMLLSIPTFLFIRFFNYKMKKRNQINGYHELGCILFFIFMTGLFSQTFTSIQSFSINNISLNNINCIPFRVFTDTYQEVVKNKHINYFIINFLGNIIMFIPIGLMIPLLWNISNKKVILLGFSISMLIEFFQLFLSRGTDIDDLWLNTLGVAIGLLIYTSLSHNFTSKFKYKK